MRIEGCHKYKWGSLLDVWNVEGLWWWQQNDTCLVALFFWKWSLNMEGECRLLVPSDPRSCFVAFPVFWAARRDKNNSCIAIKQRTLVCYFFFPENMLAVGSFLLPQALPPPPTFHFLLESLAGLNGRTTLPSSNDTLVQFHIWCEIIHSPSSKWRQMVFIISFPIIVDRAPEIWTSVKIMNGAQPEEKLHFPTNNCSLSDGKVR